jgi:hypothetical protein
VVRQESAAAGEEPNDAKEGARARRAFLLRLPPDLLAELRAWANQDLRSLNAHLEFLLREAVRRRRGTADS